MTIYLATDHAGFELKEKVKSFLTNLGHEVKDLGANNFDKEDDYPDFISQAAKAVAENTENKAIVFGGSGQGEAMVANRFKGVRAAVFYGPGLATKPVDASLRGSMDPFEIIRLSKEHNDANILSIGARFVSEKTALEAIKLWLKTPFSNDSRHKRRIEKF